MSRHEESRGFGLRDVPAMYALLGLGAFVIGALSVMQDDSWWHLRGGQWILQHGSVNPDYSSGRGTFLKDRPCRFPS